MDSKVELNSVLKIIRQYHALSQKELSKKLDISSSRLNEIEHGKKSVSLEILDKYAYFFDIAPSCILKLAEFLKKYKTTYLTREMMQGKILDILEWAECVGLIEST